jgi:large subunit ribosomal protein L25
MEIQQLRVNHRSEQGKGPARQLRRKGWIPGVVYGKGAQTVSVEIDPQGLLKALSTATGRNTFMRLTGNEEALLKDKVVLAKDLQFHPVQRRLIHADLYEVNMAVAIEVQIPIVLTGKPEIMPEGTILQQERRQLSIRCLPDRIPNKIELDVSQLKVGESLHVRDLKLLDGVTALDDAGFTVVSIVTLKIEVEAAPAAEAVPAEGEVPVEGAVPAEGAAPAEGAEAAPAEKGKKEAAPAERGKKEAAPDKGKGADKGKGGDKGKEKK